MGILDLPRDQFLGAISELNAQGVNTDDLVREYRRQNSPFAAAYDWADRAASNVADRGREAGFFGLLSKPEGTSGMEAIRNLRLEPQNFVAGLLGGAAQAVDAPSSAAMGLIPSQDMPMEALNTAGMAQLGGAAMPAPRGSLRSGSIRNAPDPTLMDALEARYQQMQLKPKDRIQPDQNYGVFFDENYAEGMPRSEVYDLSQSYPRNPDPSSPLPKGDRARALVDRRSEIATALAQRIRESGQMDADTRYFYHTDGPLYRAALRSGLSPEQATAYVDEFSNYFAATSPRTPVTQNLQNATLAMAKESQGIPFRSVIGRGTVDAKTGERGLSESGYPMMTGSGGIHGGLLDAVISGDGISTYTNTKPAMFGANMTGNRTGVTVDTHAIRGVLQTLNQIDAGSVPESFILPKFREQYRADPTTLTPDMIDDSLGKQMIEDASGNKVNAQTEYSVFADIFHDAAKELGVSPAEAQSMAWFGFGGDTNLVSDPKTVSKVFDERLNITAQALGIPVDQAARLVFSKQIPLMANASPALGTGLLGQYQDQQWQGRARRAEMR
jgi:hypothetical protein